jgi:flagellar protein FlaG
MGAMTTNVALTPAGTELPPSIPTSKPAVPILPAAAAAAAAEETAVKKTVSGIALTGPNSGSSVSLEAQPIDLRLVIEPDKISGGYIYKTVDRRTGEVVQQLPRKEVLELRHAAAYHSGDVFDGRS